MSFYYKLLVPKHNLLAVISLSTIKWLTDFSILGNVHACNVQISSLLFFQPTFLSFSTSLAGRFVAVAEEYLRANLKIMSWNGSRKRMSNDPQICIIYRTCNRNFHNTVEWTLKIHTKKTSPFTLHLNKFIFMNGSNRPL